MAEWLKRVIDEVDKEYERLPAWKKIDSDRKVLTAAPKEDRRSSSIREPLVRERIR